MTLTTAYFVSPVILSSVSALGDLFDTPYFVSSSIMILVKPGKLSRIYKRKLTHEEGGLPRKHREASPKPKVE